MPNYAVPPELKKEIHELAWQKRTDRSVLPGTDDFMRSFVVNGFLHDAVVAGYIGGAFNVTSLFAP